MDSKEVQEDRQMSGAHVRFCLCGFQCLFYFKYRHLHKHKAMLKKNCVVSPPWMWLDAKKKQGSLVTLGGTNWHLIPSCEPKNTHRSGLWKKRTFFPVKSFCQEVEENVLFILVVELLHRESPHSEAFSWFFQAEAPRGCSSVFGEMLAVVGF